MQSDIFRAETFYYLSMRLVDREKLMRLPTFPPPPRPRGWGWIGRCSCWSTLALATMSIVLGCTW